MNRIFLGPLVHWLVLVIVIGLGYLAGHARLHVTNFNLFVVLVIAGTVISLMIIIGTSNLRTRITRDPIEDDVETEAAPGTARPDQG